MLPDSNGETTNSEKDDSDLSDIDLEVLPKKTKAVSKVQISTNNHQPNY